MRIEGNVEDIIFRNMDTGYTVMNVESKGELITCVGKAVSVNVGENVSLTGEYVTNAKFGDQFSFDSIDVVEPRTKDAIFKYLSSGLIRGVGPVTAHAIVDKFGEDTLSIMEYAPEKLSEVRGISHRKAIEIGEYFADIKRMQNAVIFLQQYDITSNLAVKIYNVYKDKTVDTVSANPYQMVEDIDGIGFLSADKIAVKMGIEPDSPFRMRAAILHVLSDNSEKCGHTFLPRESLYLQVRDLLSLDDEIANALFDNEIERLQIENSVKCFTSKGEACVCTTLFYIMESGIASKLAMSMMSNVEGSLDVDREIEEYQRINSISLHETQKDAIRQALKNQVTIITGGPGTGKTTIVRCILQAFRNITRKIFLLAPTGRASKRLSEACSYKASTIHRALEVSFKGEGGVRFNYNEKNKLMADVVIVDEMSMVDVSLFYSLLRALPSTCKLILVGDKDQLPSVGAGNVLHDLISCGHIPCVKLTHIYRQDNNSLIVLNAHAINDGKMPDLSNHSSDFFYENKPELADMADCVVNLVTMRLPKFLSCEPTDIQVLCPMKSGLCGVDNLNKRLQAIINPPKLNKTEIEFDTRTLREGDKVMQVVNNYDLEWRKSQEKFDEHGQGVFNGDIGRITHIDTQTGETTVLFDDDRECVYSRIDAHELYSCYSMTIHKSQGSEFDAVVIPVVAGSPQIVTRNLLYTAVTRAKKLVVLVGPKKNIARMIYNDYTAGRFSMLAELIKVKMSQMEQLYS